MAHVTEPTRPGRRALDGRSAETVDRLLDAGLEVLREQGYDQLSMREVCRRAGLTHATAYGYFSAKQHLVAEAYRRRVAQWCAQPLSSGQPLARLSGVFTELGEFMTAEPDLCMAASAALLSPDPDVRRIRGRIGESMFHRLGQAAGSDCGPRVLDALNIALSGAMVQAGMNYSSYEEMVDRLTSAAGLLLGER